MTITPAQIRFNAALTLASPHGCDRRAALFAVVRGDGGPVRRRVGKLLQRLHRARPRRPVDRAPELALRPVRRPDPPDRQHPAGFVPSASRALPRLPPALLAALPAGRSAGRADRDGAVADVRVRGSRRGAGDPHLPVRRLLRVRRLADRAVVHRPRDHALARRDHPAGDSGVLPVRLRRAPGVLAGAADRRRRRLPVPAHHRRLLLLRAQARGPGPGRRQAARADRRAARMAGAAVRADGRRLRGLAHQPSDRHLVAPPATGGGRRRASPPRAGAVRPVPGGRRAHLRFRRAAPARAAGGLIDQRSSRAASGLAALAAASPPAAASGAAAPPSAAGGLATGTRGSGSPHITRRCRYSGSPYSSSDRQTWYGRFTVSPPTVSSASWSVTTRLTPAFSVHFTSISILRALSTDSGSRRQFSLRIRRAWLSWKSFSKANRSLPPWTRLPSDHPSRSCAFTTRGGSDVLISRASKYSWSPHMSSKPTCPGCTADKSRRIATPQARENATPTHRPSTPARGIAGGQLTGVRLSCQ